MYCTPPPTVLHVPAVAFHSATWLSGEMSPATNRAPLYCAMAYTTPPTPLPSADACVPFHAAMPLADTPSSEPIEPPT